MEDEIIGKTINVFDVLAVHGCNVRGVKEYRVRCRLCGNEKTLLKDGILSFKSCGCQRYASQAGNKRWKGVGDMRHRYFRAMTHNARQRDIPVTITQDQMWELFLKQNKKCAITGELLTLDTRDSLHDGTASLDRIDSSKGYVEGNVQWVHKIVNFMKRGMMEKELRQWCTKILSSNRK